MRQFSRLATLLAATAVFSFAAQSFAQNVSIDPSGRYYRNAAGQPVFLIGYYGWAAVPDGFFIDHPSRYTPIMQQGSPYKINYVRISLCVNRFTSTTNPPVWSGSPTPVPFLYVGNPAKADLNQWDNTFWTGLQNQCTIAQQNGVIVHVSFFDGVELRSNGGAAYGYANSFWNPGNQSASFYSNPDCNSNGQIDDSGPTCEFYQLNNFNNDVGIGHYQRLLISKAITTLAGFNNVIFELGNELGGSDATWSQTVINYAKSLTSKPVTQENNSVGGPQQAPNIDGWAEHVADTPAQVKANVAAIVGQGHPAWEDPDGPALSNANVSADDLRRAAWYSFAGGAACWGGFTVDFWSFGFGFSTTKANYYKYLQDFISLSGVPFQNMVPRHDLVGNNSENSCLAKVGNDYVVYVLNDASVTVDLINMTGSANWRTYDPRTGTFSGFSSVAGGSVQNFNKPGGADDWVVQITGGGGEVLNWNTLGTTLDLGAGIVPAVATDAQGNVHTIFVNGNTVQYRKYTSAFGLLTSESISAPSGAYYPHIMCDSNSVPHITYTNGTVDYANNCYYTNRIGGSWKSPIIAFSVSGADALWYPRIGLWSTFAYIGCQRGASGALVGQIVRVTNLSTTPSTDASVQTAMRSGISVDGNGFVHAIGRNGGAGTFYQKYNSNLTTAGNFVDLNFGYPGGGQTAWSDGGNVTHLVAWSRQANAAFPCNDRCGMDYNNTSRQNPDQSFQAAIQGLLGGAAGTGPDGGSEVSGWWNDDVAPVITKDALGVVYVAWREWTPSGLGRITKVDASGFTQTCNTDPNCGGNNCNGTTFSGGGITRRRWWNCEIAPALSRGVYVAWEAGGHSFLRPVGASISSSSSPGTLNVKPAGTITVDGNSSDWVLGDFVTKSRGGEGTTGDIALVGFDGGSTVYRGAYAGVLPTNAADHTAKVYSRQNSTYLYFLIRNDDNQIQTQNPVGSNWANDCVEFYIDPTNDGGSSAMSNSTSDIQLVIDAANQKNVYSTTGGYATQVLAGVTSAVTTDGTGWWLEVRITKTALDGDIPANGGKFGLDFNFRDNDNNNDAALTTVYTWSESSTAGFPSKIPDHWGDGVIRGPFGGTARPIPGIVQAEDYDNGGEGVAYHDTDTANNGGQYRTTEGVDVETCTDTGGGFDVGYISASEWMEYTVNVNTTGDYAIKMRMSSAAGGGSFHLSLNGVALTAIKSMADTGGWQNWTTIIVPGIFMAAGNNKVLRFTTDSGAYNFNYMDFAFSGADVVSIDMGSPNIEDGMTNVSCCDGNTIAWTIGGHITGNNADIPDHYMYFAVADVYVFQGNKNNVTITFDYFDKDTGTLSLQYDGTSNAYTAGPSVALTNSLTWKTAVWQVGDAYFGNRENGLADFRIFYSGVDFYIDTVTAFATVGTPPPGQASNPSPANAATLVPITSTLSWTAGSNATNRDVRFGTVNPPPFVINQTATTYNPGTLAANTTYFWRIDEKNTAGTTTGVVWSFTTLPLPGAASGPNPANGATLVAITADPSWTAGSNATSHDVRFGTVNPPPFVLNQAGTTYAAPTLTPNTVYFWRIDEKNGSGTTTGTVWSFTTLPLPGVASAPNPANAATGVSITAALSWTAGSNAASHDVRYGTANPPPFVQNQAGTSYTPPTKAPNTTYFWRIDEVNSSGTTTGTVWSFTTLPLPGLATAPNPANAATGVSITATLSWTAGSNAASHDVRFGTANPPPLIQNQAGTTYNPGTLAAGTTYFWRIDEKNTSGTTTGTVWSFTTLALPGLATAPNPANAATGVSITPTLSWTAGSNATSHDVRFGTANPPPFIQNQAGTTYAPSTLANNTVYFWRIDEKNGSGTTTGTVWSFTTAAAGPPTLLVKNIASALTIDGNSSDWNVASYVTKIRGGEFGNGDIALVGFDGGSTVYRGAFALVLPTNAADHTAKVYSRHDSTYLYFLIRQDDNQIQTQNGVAMNWANDCVEFYIDPTNNGGSTAMNNSTSDIQLVIDALNQKNVYMTTAGYATQVLAGVTSAVTTDGTGWWLEARIQKSVLDGDIPANGTIGLDFNFRDNDNNNDPALTTVYTWTESSTAGFPSKIPDHWGKASLPVLSAPGLATSPTPANGATGVTASGTTLSWTAGLDATLHGVRFGTANPPPFIQNQAGTTYNTGAMSGSTTYFWRIDEINGSGTTTGTVWSFTTAATGPVTLNNSAFPSNADGWNIVVWRAFSGYTDGTMAWASTNGNPSGNMASTGSGATDSTDRCTREGGEINKGVSTSGYNTLVQVVYDLRFDTNQTGGTCTGSCGGAELEGDCADKIAVYYSTAGTGGPWTLLEAVNASALAQNVWSTRTINCPAAANNKPNFAVRLRFQFNTTSDSSRLDNVKVIATP